MEIPDLVRERLGDESVEATVNLGDEDVVCVTPTRTLVYRSEGLLSDESVAIYSHDVERFDVSKGRRKTKFEFEYVDGSDSFTVPGDRTETILKLLVGGILHVAAVTDDGESISDVFTFSELTLVVTSKRLVKHIGTALWDEDFEEYPYDDVTGLSFEEGSVATQVVLSVDGRPERIKAPSDDAAMFKRSLKQALFAYHEVNSIGAFNEKVGPDDESGQTESDDTGGSLSLDDGISPLVSDEKDDAAGRSGAAGTGVGRSASRDQPGESASTARTDRPGSDAGTASNTAGDPAGSTSVDTVSTDPDPDPDPNPDPDPDPLANDRASGAATVDPEDVETMKKQISTLTKAVKKQNELLRDQQETIDQLIEELRRGR